MNNLLKEENIRKTFLIVSIVLFITSLTQKCYCTGNECGDSIAVLFTGMFFLLGEWDAFPWLANPAILVAWLCFKKYPKTSLIASIIAVLLAVSFLFFKEITTDEGGGHSKITGYKLGYWLWLLSTMVMLVGNLLLIIQKNKAPIKVT